MDILYIGGLVAAFIAAALMVQGLLDLTGANESQDDKRLSRRIRQLRSAAAKADGLSLLRSKQGRQERAIDQMMAVLPSYGSLAEMISQAGETTDSIVFVGRSLIMGLIAGLLVLALDQPWILVGLVGASVVVLPFVLLLRRRRLRLAQIEKQLPDAVELVARAMRAGHAFAPSLQMIADELPQPIAGEFRQVSEEIGFGIPLRDALMALTRRVPIDDLRYFVIAVILQRETGGNLAEILDTIGHLIRERFKLLGEVRVLTAEGRLSAWILAALPFATAAGFLVINPAFITGLWEDSLGRTLVIAALGMMVMGVFWLTRIVKIRI